MTLRPTREELEEQRQLQRRVREAIRAEMEALDIVGVPTPEQRARLLERARQVVAEHNQGRAELGLPPRGDPRVLAELYLREELGYGPLQALMDDPEVEEIMVNAPDRVFCVRSGGLQELTDVQFEDDDELLRYATRLVANLGRRLDWASPMADGRLPDGSRLNVVIPPISEHPVLTIRKFVLKAHDLGGLVELGTLSPEAAAYLEACVRARLSILVSGGTASGKTTLLNALGAAIPRRERIVTIEETRELQVDRVIPNCVPLEARQAGLEGTGEVTIRDLVRNSLRMRPSRIIVGEVRGAEALDMLNAMNSGHEGSMCTLHANGPREALSKLRIYTLMAPDAPASAVQEVIAQAVQLVVQMQLLQELGRRVVASIYEVTGLEGDQVVGQEIFRWEEGVLRWTGVRPRRAQALTGGPFPWDRAYVMGEKEEEW